MVDPLHRLPAQYDPMASCQVPRPAWLLSERCPRATTPASGTTRTRHRIWLHPDQTYQQSRLRARSLTPIAGLHHSEAPVEAVSRPEARTSDAIGRPPGTTRLSSALRARPTPRCSGAGSRLGPPALGLAAAKVVGTGRSMPASAKATRQGRWRTHGRSLRCVSCIGLPLEEAVCTAMRNHGRDPSPIPGWAAGLTNPDRWLIMVQQDHETHRLRPDSLAPLTAGQRP